MRCDGSLPNSRWVPSPSHAGTCSRLYSKNPEPFYGTGRQPTRRGIPSQGKAHRCSGNRPSRWPSTRRSGGPSWRFPPGSGQPPISRIGRDAQPEETADLMGCRPGRAKRYLGLAHRQLKRTLGRDVDVRATFRAVFDTVVEPVPPTLDWPDLEARVIQAPPLGRSPRRRLIAAPAGRWVWAVAAAVIVVVIVGGSGAAAAGVKARTLRPSSPNPKYRRRCRHRRRPSRPLRLRRRRRSRSRHPDDLAGSLSSRTWSSDRSYSMTTDGNRWVGVGFADMPSITGDPDAIGWAATFWTSSDGIDWEPIPHDDRAFGNADDFALARTSRPEAPASWPSAMPSIGRDTT